LSVVRTTGWKVSRAVVPISSLSSAAEPMPGHLDQDAVGALALDGRLAGAGLVHPAADDLERLLHGAVVGGGAFGGRQRDHDLVAVGGTSRLVRAGAGKHAAHRAGQVAHHLQRPRHALGLGYLHAQLGRWRGLAAHVADHGRALGAERVAHLGPERVDAVRIDVGDQHLGQQMRAAAQIEPEVDDGRGQPVGPERALVGQFGRHHALRLDRAHGVVVPLDAVIEQVRAANITQGRQAPR
jgi:hypothetical protein